MSYPSPDPRAAGTGRSPVRLAARAARFVLLLAITAAAPARAWINDQNGNRIDDRIESVQAGGLAAAFEDGDLTKRMRFGVFPGTPIQYPIYIRYDHHPGASETAALASLGLTIVHPYRAIDAIRAQASYAQVQAIVALPGVQRVEAVPMYYAFNHYGARVVRARDSRGLGASQNYVLFPSARAELGLDGTGVVVAILDTGVNDAQDSVNAGYPGHESVRGKFLGGGNFYAGDPNLNTPINASENPSDHGSEASSFHATHVAGTAIGTGGPGGFFGGVAPAARLVDCKVLSDAGAGFGAADGLDWCIAHADASWPGATGPDAIYHGIQVANMSLGCLSCSSDGTDTDEAMVNAAVDAGITVCIATGNGSTQNSISSPAGAAKCIAVGASAANTTLDRSDDRVTDFSNEGPRADDGDLDKTDEMKPSIVAPGAGIVSANGDPTTDGTFYKVLNGTSMATPHAVGCVALLKQLDPTLTPLQIRTILQNTAEHNIPSVKGDRPNDPFGVDPNYDPGCGWGLVDVYAAAKEAINSTSGVQVVQFRPVARPADGAVDVRWITQREYSFTGFDVYRAPDAGGAPGVFAKLNLAAVAPAGHSAIQGVSNRTPYTYTDTDPALTIGQTYWYRVAWVDGGGSHFEPPAPVTFGSSPRIATVYYSLTHNAVANDLLIRYGTSATYSTSFAQFFRTGPAESQQDSAVAITSPPNAATSTFGNVQHYWSVGLTAADGVGSYLPPTPSHPWFLDVAEGGYVNRSGRVNSFSIFVNDAPGSAGGTTYATGDPTPRPTVENTSTTLWIPATPPVAVEMARLDAASEAGGVRLRLQLAGAIPDAVALVYRSTSEQFASRTVLTNQPLPLSGGALSYLDASADPNLSYFYWIEVRKPDGTSLWSGPAAVAARITFAAPPYPNPSRRATTIEYRIASDVAGSGAVPVSITVHDLQGRRVRTLRSANQSAGDYRVEWDHRDERGATVGGGIYYVLFRAGALTQNARIAVVR